MPKFIVPDWGDKIDSGIGLSYRPSSLVDSGIGLSYRPAGRPVRQPLHRVLTRLGIGDQHHKMLRTKAVPVVDSSLQLSIFAQHWVWQALLSFNHSAKHAHPLSFSQANLGEMANLEVLCVLYYRSPCSPCNTQE
jgi:hypothetical protein